MHELGITRSVVGIACENAYNKRVKRVVLRIGQFAGVSVEAISFCFDVVAKGTLCEGAALEIESVAGRARCKACGTEFALPSLAARCFCGQHNFDIMAGEELKVHQIETEVS